MGGARRKKIITIPHTLTNGRWKPPFKQKKMNELATQANTSKELTMINSKDFVGLIEAFNKKLNTEPPQSEIQINKQAKNSKYLPISFVRMKLDEIFLGLWNFEMIREQVIANEIIGVGILEYYHPIAKVWLKRSGTAAVMIQQVSKENGGSGRISNIDDKIKNTLVKDFPHLESEVLKSCAKKLGKMLGGDLNRAFEDTYTPIYTEEINYEEKMAILKPKIDSCATVDELLKIYNEEVEMQQNKLFLDYFSMKRKKIQLKK